MRYFDVLLLSGAVMFLAACAGSYPEDSNDEFVSLANEYIEKYFKMYPETATALGDHRYDDRLNDYSAAGVKAGLEFNKRYLESFRKIDTGKLDQTNRIDLFILLNEIEKSIYRIDTLKEHEWNPLVYNVGGAIYNLIARDFAPLEERLENVRARLEMIPRVTAFAKANLKNTPTVHTETAILQN